MVAAAVGGTVLVAGAAPVAAQASSAGSSRIEQGSLIPSVAPGSLFGTPSLSIAALTQLAAPIPVTSALGSIAAAGSGDFSRPGAPATPSGALAVRDPLIDRSAVLRVEPLFPRSVDPVDRRAEVWTVTSASMQRAVRVEVYRAPAGLDAPSVYFLDGLGSDTPSAWSKGTGWGDAELRDRAVNIIAPTGAPAAMWADWLEDDPVLGPNKWETFLVEELPELLATGITGLAPPLAHNGSWGVMGLSMGASAAVHLANTHAMFGAAAGFSGAYSSTDELGYQYARLTVSALGGDVGNLWGPRGGDPWGRHDTLADPSGLAGKHLYLSAATGLVGSSELGRFGSNEMILLDGHVLEKASIESTRSLESALARIPWVTLKTSYMPTGIHNWPVLATHFKPGTDHILAGLSPAIPNGQATAARGGEGIRDESGGSIGSSGSERAVGSARAVGSTGSAGAAGS